MALKRLTVDKLEHVNQEILNWLRWQDKVANTKQYSDNWFKAVRERNACHTIIMNITGLTMSRVDDLVYNKVNTATYWLPDGQIRRKGESS
jgi:hypothetical protein